MKTNFRAAIKCMLHKITSNITRMFFFSQWSNIELPFRKKKYPNNDGRPKINWWKYEDKLQGIEKPWSMFYYCNEPLRLDRYVYHWRSEFFIARTRFLLKKPLKSPTEYRMGWELVVKCTWQICMQNWTQETNKTSTSNENDCVHMKNVKSQKRTIPYEVLTTRSLSRPVHPIASSDNPLLNVTLKRYPQVLK